MRKSPYRHQVSKHTRMGKTIQPFMRGKGAAPPQQRRVIKLTTGGWNANLTADKRRRGLLASIPKNLSQKRRLRIAAEKLQRIALDSRADKATKMKANADYDWATEKIQKFTNPVFTPAEQEEVLKAMIHNWELGRHEKTVGSFREAHQIAESELRAAGWIIDKEDVHGRMTTRYGYQPRDPDRPTLEIRRREAAIQQEEKQLEAQAQP